MSFDLQPNLKGELIELRPLTPEDWDDLFAVASDPLIWEQHPECDRYKEDVFKTFFREALESGGAFVVIDKRLNKSSDRRDSTVTPAEIGGEIG
jgi:RimJ/RimL family protein N-acetyltransferase